MDLDFWGVGGPFQSDCTCVSATSHMADHRLVSNRCDGDCSGVLLAKEKAIFIDRETNVESAEFVSCWRQRAPKWLRNEIDFSGLCRHRINRASLVLTCILRACSL